MPRIDSELTYYLLLNLISLNMMLGEVCSIKEFTLPLQWRPKTSALFRWCAFLVLLHLLCQLKDMKSVLQTQQTHEDLMNRRLSLPQNKESDPADVLQRSIAFEVNHPNLALEAMDKGRTGGTTNSPRLRAAILSDKKEQGPGTTIARRHAYAFLITACNPETRNYRGFLHNVLVAAYALRTSGTKSDSVLLVQMGVDTQNEYLPESEVLALQKLNVIIKYLEKPKADNIYNDISATFRVLELVNYTRVLYMDAAVLPHGNLDYLFALSEGENATLKENMIVATGSGPAHGGFFMLAPHATDGDQIQSIIRRQQAQAKATGFGFNFTTGWGHQIEAPDEWRDSLGKRGRDWKFHGGFAAQGLLYHWVKYVKKTVSIVIEKEIENWSAGSENDPSRLENTFLSANIVGFGSGHELRVQPGYKPSPYRDFTLFTAKGKPWEFDVALPDIPDAKAASHGQELWFHLFRKVNLELNLGLDVENITQTVATPSSKMSPTLDHTQSALENATAVEDKHQSATPTRHAYVFLIAACNPETRNYRGFLYNVLVASYVLRSSGTKSDIVLLVQMGVDTQSEYLPESEVLALQKLNVNIKYLEKPKADNFYNAMLAKFRVLEMVNYTRVLFMDADVLPHGNLDYLFEMSEGDNATLKANLVIATGSEPANGGFFMLAPQATDSDQLQGIIRRQHAQAKATGVAFNFTTGWGHQFEAPDEWRDSLGKRGRNWKFHGGFADQGLLYHWVKYVKKNVSIVIENEIENWSSASEDDPVHLENIFQSANISGFGSGHDLRVQPGYKPSPYRDFTHFTANRKPWEFQKAFPDLPDAKAASHGQELWFHLLRKVNLEHNLGWDVENITQTVGTPSLGRFPSLDHIRRAVA